MGVYRCYSEKRNGFDIEARSLFRDLRDFLEIRGLEAVRMFFRYDIEGISESLFSSAIGTVFSEPQTDYCYIETVPEFRARCRTLIVESLPGQFDQRADSCAQCIQLLAMTKTANSGANGARPTVRTATMYVFFGDIGDTDMLKLRGYLINPVESREAAAGKPETLALDHPGPAPVETLSGFIDADDNGLRGYLDIYGLAMDIPDLRAIQAYFRDTETRDPTVTELRVIDTYWSDHCRHTTFNTHIAHVSISDPEVNGAYNAYLDARREVYGASADSRPQTLMDIATIAAKALRKRGFLLNLDISEEVNACSIHVNADVDGKSEDWLISFKNETHNHPTEIEPFGGAATCIGGAIRDPLSGRAYVYQGMRITGAGDPRSPSGDTIPGKLPQKKLTVTAAKGFSSYGNQIGLAAGLVHELYHPGFIAKRMELGAVIGAVKADNIKRETPSPGDKILLIGGRTGRDGIGGATGSSKSHTEESIISMASEVQKGNAPEERKLQRLFLDPEVTGIIKKCNDFGAGGVSVAVGELADGLDIDLDLVRLKYEGLTGTDIAISESQERMAVVVAPRDTDTLISKASGENLEAYIIAEVTESPRLIMRYNGNVIVDLSRGFLSTNGAVKRASVSVPANKATETGSRKAGVTVSGKKNADRFRALVGDIRFCSQRGLHSMFDGTVGASSVLMKQGGRTQSTPVQAMAALLPAGFSTPYTATATSTCSVMSFGYDPYLSSENPYAGAKTAVVTSAAKLVASGCDPDGIYLTFQEYFGRLYDDPARWGNPFAALLGAFEAQMGLNIAAIGGKDSMSGSYHDTDVPPTLVSFAIASNDAQYVLSPEFKEANHDVIVFYSGEELSLVKQTWRVIRKLVEENAVISAWAVTEGGIAEGVFKMTLGNEIGFEFTGLDTEAIFSYAPGMIIAEAARPVPGAVTIGRTIAEPVIRIGNDTLSIAELKAVWENGLESVFPATAKQHGNAPKISFSDRSILIAGESFAKPRALIFAFPGTNSEIDTARAVSRSGGDPKIFVVRNLTAATLENSISEAVRELRNSQMVIIPGGFSFGDEPDGTAKFITVFFRNSALAAAIHEHLNLRDGLLLGICNGFQALIKLGLVPFGEIVPPDSGSASSGTRCVTGTENNPDCRFTLPDEESPSPAITGRPTLTNNVIGRHQAGYIYTRVASVNSPWMNLCNVGDIHAIAISHGEGRFVAPDGMLSQLAADGRIATQYTDVCGDPSMDILINPNGSLLAVEGLFSPDGRVFGKMGHTERHGQYIAKNIYGNKHQPIFESGVNYFK